MFESILVFENQSFNLSSKTYFPSNPSQSEFSWKSSNGYNITIVFAPRGEELSIECIYNGYQISDSLMSQILRHLEFSLVSMVTNPGNLIILIKIEKYFN